MLKLYFSRKIVFSLLDHSFKKLIQITLRKILLLIQSFFLTVDYSQLKYFFKISER